MIKNQLRDNAREKDGYKYYKELKEYMKAENVPLKFTLEGLEILSTKNPKEISIERTFGINDDRKVEILITDEEFEKRRSKVPEVVKYELWQEGRNAIIKGFKTEKERQAFLNGEKIAKIMQSVEIADEDTEKVIETKKKKQRNLVANYLLGIYDRRNISNQNINEQSQSQQDEERIITLRKNIENGINTQPIDKQMRDKLELLKRYLALMDNRKNENEQNNNRNGENKDNVEEHELLRKYLNIKEKGLAIDANIVLESLEKDVNKRIEDKIDKQVEISPEDSEYAKKLQNGQHFFDLVKKGFDRTSRIFALTTGKVDFDFLEKLIQNYNGQDKELLEYIEFKRKILEQAQTYLKIMLKKSICIIAMLNHLRYIYVQLMKQKKMNLLQLNLIKHKKMKNKHLIQNLKLYINWQIKLLNNQKEGIHIKLDLMILEMIDKLYNVKVRYLNLTFVLWKYLETTLNK